ncbi:hypothetical protein FB451DRAFT_1368486 [Mycena latifolia]|nr:hypothetical protein FB451DRAFT_1368486 [Mycena latifolia]
MLAIATTQQLSLVDPQALRRPPIPSSVPSCLSLLAPCIASAWSPDNLYLFLSSLNTIHQYNPALNTLTDIFSSPDSITHLVCKTTSSLAFAAADKVHVLESTKVIQSFDSHKAPITSLALANDLLATTSAGAAHVHNLLLGSHTVLRGLNLAGQRITTCAFHPHSRTRLLLGVARFRRLWWRLRASSGNVGLVDLDKEKALFRTLSLKVPLTSIEFSPEGASIYLGTEHGKLLIMDLRALDKPPKTVVVSESGCRVETMTVQKRNKGSTESVTKPTVAATKVSAEGNNPSRRASGTAAPTVLLAKTVPKVASSPSKGRTAFGASPVRRPSALSAQQVAISPRAMSNANPKIFSPVRDPQGNSARSGARQLPSSKDTESASIGRPSRLSVTSKMGKTVTTDSASARSAAPTGEPDARSRMVSSSRTVAQSISVKPARSRSGSSASRPGSSASQRSPPPPVPSLPAARTDPEDRSKGNGKGKGKTVIFKAEHDENLPGDDEKERERERSLSMQISPRRPSSAGLGNSASWAPSPLRNAIPTSPASGNTSAHDLLRTIVRDVMFDFQQEQRSEMVGLHLDLLKMGRGWKKELRELMDEQESRPNSNAPANDAYKVWLPPPDASRAAAPAPNTWIHASGQSSARPSGRSSSRARPDASSVPTSSTYKYATVPPNSTGFYYPNPVQAQPFPPQYYPPGSLDRPDSRLGYVPYPYPNPQYPQSFATAPAPSQATTSNRREDKTRNAGDGRGSSTAPAGRPSSSRKHSEKDDGGRAAPRPSSSSTRENKKEEAEVKKPKHRTREASETRKRRDSQVGDSYAEKYRDKSSRKESRRDGKSGQNARVEEGESSDSSIQRPPSSAGHRRRQLKEGHSLFTMNKPQQEPIPFPAGSRPGLPMQPTAASSSSGKHTPQIPRMPVYLPTNNTRPLRPGEGQPGLSESDTDHGTFNRGRNFWRGNALANVKQSKPALQPSAPPVVDKKVKESKGLWPFSRSKSSQKLPQNMPTAPPSTAKISAKKTRADSTPTRVPQLPVDSTRHPEYRRHASDNAIGGHHDVSLQADRAPTPQEFRSRSVVPDVQSSSGSRALFFATQPSESSSRAVASQQAAPYPLRSRNEAPPRPQPGAQTVENPPPSSGHRQNPPIGPLQGQVSGVAVGPQIQRPETPLRRDGRDKSNLPPIYAPAAVTRTSDYSRVPDRSTTPKVSQLVAGFEARSADTQSYIPPQAVKPITTRREVVEKPSLPQVHAPPQSSDGPGGVSASTRRPLAAANSHVVPSQSLVGKQKREDRSHTHSRPLAESSNVQARPPMNQPDVLKTQLRDLLTDNPSALRNDEKTQVQAQGPNLLPDSRLKQASVPPTLYSTAKPPDWNPSSQIYAFDQPPVQVFSAGTSSIPLTAKSEKPAEIPLFSNSAPTGSSRRPVASQSDSADRSRGGVNRPMDEVRDADRAHRQSSRPKKDPIAVMKTPSKDSSRHTSSPSPIIPTHSNNQSRSQGKTAVSQPPSTSRSQPYTAHPEAQSTGRHNGSSFHPNVHSSSFPASQRENTSTFQPSGKPHPPIASNALPTSSLDRSEDPRLTPSESSRPFPNHSLPVPSNIPPVGTSSRSVMPTSSPNPVAEAPPVLLQSSSRSSVTPGSSSNSHTVPRVPSEESILKTPSSLAPSVLHPSISRTSIPSSVASETRKKGILGMFRSKAAQQQPQSSAVDVRHPTGSSKTIDRRPQGTASGRESRARRGRSPTDSDESISRYKKKAPPPIVVPNPALPISDRKSPNSRVFPFRYLTTKRNRRISTASMDAEDGTAPNTVMGSPTASLQSSQMPAQSPPQRDPRAATQDWRNQEESDVMARGKPRRMRPGVVFDVAEDPLEETKRSRPARSKKSQPQAAEPPTTDSSGDA